MSKVKCSRELRFEIAKKYLNMPSTASISRWLRASLTQNSEKLIADEALEPFILICRIETPHHRENTRMAAMWCAGTRCLVLLPLNQQLLVTELETNNSKDHQSS